VDEPLFDTFRPPHISHGMASLKTRTSSYRAVNTIRLSYKNQSVNAVKGNSRCLFWNPYRTHKYTVLAEHRIFFYLGVLVPHFPAHKTHFFPEKCDLNSTCVLCVEGNYYFQNYKYPYIYYITSLSWDRENNHEDDISGSDDDFLGFYDG